MKQAKIKTPEKVARRMRQGRPGKSNATGLHRGFNRVRSLIVPSLIGSFFPNRIPLLGFFVVLLVSIFAAPIVQSGEPVRAWDSLDETWEMNHREGLVTARVRGKLSGAPGDRFLLLRSPAVLTSLNSGGLLLKESKSGKDGKIDYQLVIPAPAAEIDAVSSPAESAREVSFSFQIDLKDPRSGVSVPTGAASIHQIEASSDEAGWEFSAATAAKITSAKNDGTASIHLLPGRDHRIALTPRKRDPANEPVEFFIESQQLYLPSPGTVDGACLFQVRPARGMVRHLAATVPPGFTISELSGPVAAWQFDPEAQRLSAEIDPPQKELFSVTVKMQSPLPAFPAEAVLAPLTVEKAAGQTGMIGLAFGIDAKPENIAASAKLTSVNPDDFNAAIVKESGAALHRVYRFKGGGGEVTAKVAEVTPEVRVESKEVISLGEENLVWRINFAADITRSGVFQLVFSLPENFEVESVSGEELRDWTESESEDGGERLVTLHLKGKTLGRREFSLSLRASPPARNEAWTLPRFAIHQANRQTGELIVQPGAGIRLSLTSRQNVSELDPRNLGAKGRGALAFRLLQKDWSAALEIETLAPRVTGELLHDITVREARIRTSLAGLFDVENAAISSLHVQLPFSSEDSEIARTLRASGPAVAGVAPVPDAGEGLWEIQLNRRVIGELLVLLEWEEKRAPADAEGNEAEEQAEQDPRNEEFTRRPVAFPSASQVRYHVAARTAGRLELELPDLAQRWRRSDWKIIPKKLRESGNRVPPAMTLKGSAVPEALTLRVRSHSLAGALKLRMTRGAFRTVISPRGTRLTSAGLELEVIQRGHLGLTLPADSELFSLFVNGRSVEPVKAGAGQWRFPVLPDAGGSRARVLAIYLEKGLSARSVAMESPRLDIPLENITWEVLSPERLRMRRHAGNLQFTGHETAASQDRENYLSESKRRRETQAARAAELLDQANDLIRAGKQTLARQTLQSLASRSGLDAASNEDARVQLEALQTRQALVCLNTRRQRMALDRSGEESLGPGGEQLRESASRNPVIQLGELDFRPEDLSQLLQGNTSEELNAFRRIAERIVEQQSGEEIAPAGLDISPPNEGNRYRFVRGVQVTENEALKLQLVFSPETKAGGWRGLAAAVLVILLAGVFVTRFGTA